MALDERERIVNSYRVGGEIQTANNNYSSQVRNYFWN